MERRKVILSRYPYAISGMAVLTILVASAMNYFLFQADITGSELLWKKLVLFGGYLVLSIFDLVDFINYPRRKQFLQTFFFLLRVVVISFLQTIDVTFFSVALLGLIPYYAYLSLGMIVSLFSLAVEGYYLFTTYPFITDPRVLVPTGIMVFFQSISFFAGRAQRADAENMSLIEEISKSNLELRTYIEDLSKLSIMEERAKLSNDLHDSLGHYMVAANIQLEKAMAYKSISQETTEEAILNAKHSVELALKEVRRFVDSLHEKDDVFSLKERTEELIKNYSGVFDIQFNYSGNEFGFPNITRRNMFYIIQELLTNIQKHAEAKEVSVDIQFKAREVILDIKDDGIGFNPSRQMERLGHYGLENMKQRTELLNGKYKITSKRNNGTFVEIKIPRQRDQKNGGL